MCACMHADLCGHRLVQTKETTKKELTKMGEMGWWTWCADLLCVGVMQMSGRKEKKTYLLDGMGMVDAGTECGCVACCVACGRVGLLMRYLQTQMSINENEKILTWTRMCCVLCCVWTCWLADAFPADANALHSSVLA